MIFAPSILDLGPTNCDACAALQAAGLDDWCEVCRRGLDAIEREEAAERKGDEMRDERRLSRW